MAYHDVAKGRGPGQGHGEGGRGARRRGLHGAPLPAVLVAVTTVLHSAAFGQPVTVDECVRAALARSPAARAAGYDIEAAAARVRAARAAYAPQLRAEGQYGRSQGFDETVTNGGLTSTLLTVETALLDGGLRDAQFAAARARLQSAHAVAQQRRADVTLAVRAAYFSAVAARATGDIHGENLRTLRDYVGLLQRQEVLGLAVRNDVLRAQLAVHTAQAAGRAADAEFAATQSELGVWTGLTIVSTAFVDPAPMTGPPESAALVETSPVVADARAALEAVRHEADAVRSEWRGHLTLSASGGALGVQPGPTFRDNSGGQFQFGVTVPLYDGGGIAARVAAAVAAVGAAEAALEQSRQTTQVALARATAEAARARDDLAIWEGAAPQAAEDFQLMRARYVGGGNVRLLEVLDALNQYVEARVHAVQARLAYRLAIATQEQVLGQVPE